MCHAMKLRRHKYIKDDVSMPTFCPHYLCRHKYKFCVAINMYKNVDFLPHKLRHQIFKISTHIQYVVIN